MEETVAPVFIRSDEGRAEVPHRVSKPRQKYQYTNDENENSPLSRVDIVDVPLSCFMFSCEASPFRS